jgi:hypothetical protein
VLFSTARTLENRAMVGDFIFGPVCDAVGFSWPR